MKKEKRVSTKKLVVEFFAIVFGVLMALALDAWYEQYQKKQLSREYISRLTDELFEARQLLEKMDRLITRCINAGTEVSGFFETKKPYKDESRLIVSLYNMGRDMPDRFITSTYDDLIATGNLGLIEQVSQRDAILQAYSSLRNYEQYLAPYRDEYLAGVRGWIPQKVISQIRERCPSGI